ncbi:MAG: hypothetical protein ACYCU7_18760 [Acidimicrobiales bacterium]
MAEVTPERMREIDEALKCADVDDYGLDDRCRALSDALQRAWAERDAAAEEADALRRVAEVAANKFQRDESGSPLGYFCAVAVCPRCGIYMNSVDKQCNHCDADDIRAVLTRPRTRYGEIAEARRRVCAAAKAVRDSMCCLRPGCDVRHRPRQDGLDALWAALDALEKVGDGGHEPGFGGLLS